MWAVGNSAGPEATKMGKKRGYLGSAMLWPALALPRS